MAGRGAADPAAAGGRWIALFGRECLSRIPVCRSAVPQEIGAVAGVLLIAGLVDATSGSSSFVAWIASSALDNAAISVALAVLAVTLTMIGPGAWSMDAAVRQETHRDTEMPSPESGSAGSDQATN